jgi:hypothetical protein
MLIEVEDMMEWFDSGHPKSRYVVRRRTSKLSFLMAFSVAGCGSASAADLSVIGIINCSNLVGGGQLSWGANAPGSKTVWKSNSPLNICVTVTAVFGSYTFSVLPGGAATTVSSTSYLTNNTPDTKTVCVLNGTATSVTFTHTSNVQGSAYYSICRY